MLNKFFQFLKGYVIIKIIGLGTERFINICARRGIDVRDVKHNSDGTADLLISVQDFRSIRPIARKAKVRVKIIQKKGAFELKKVYGKRYALIIGSLCVILFFAVMSQFIWVVQINGVYESDVDEIARILEDNGVRVGAFKGSLPQITDIKHNLINGTDTVSWAWVYLEGSCARVEIYEKRLKPLTVDTSKPCNIVAAYDGFIQRIDVKKGERAAKNEMPVSVGDVLISGKVPVFRTGDDEKYKYVHAEGRVKAVTYHTAQKEQKLYYQSRIKTGEHKTYYSLEIFGKKFDLYRSDEPEFEEYDVQQKRHELKFPFFGYVGLCLSTKECYEVNIHNEPVSKEAAALIAQNELEKQIAGELYKNPQLTDRQLEWEDIDENTISVKLTMSFIEDIGVENTIP